jgi:spermidine synthase
MSDRFGLSVSSRLGLYAAVALTGAAVMALELLGTRVLAPFYGTSLIVWAALISVTLTALAAGYFLGGWLASRGHVRQAHVLALAGVACAAVPVMAEPVLLATDPLGLHLGALASAALLFALPLTLLAAVGPWIIQWCCDEQSTAGSTAGVVYAVSTLGSVAGTLGLGFYLLPVFGSRSLLSAQGAILLGLAVLVSRWESRRLGQPWRPGWLFLAALSAAGLLYLAGTSRHEVRFQRESLYGKVTVVDDRRFNARWLLADASIIGGTDLASGRNLLAYQELVIEALAVRPHAKDALLIGLGAGTLVPRLTLAGLAVDVIEIDPAVFEAARRFFGFHPPGRLWVADARTQVRQIPHSYDLIVHDCFTGGSEPTHLLTLEAFLDLNARLKAHGVLLLNFVGFQAGPGREALDAVWRTLEAVFPEVHLLAADPRENFTDFLFLAASSPIPLDAKLARWQIASAPHPGPILSDDHNPLEFLQREKAKTYRALLFKQVDRSLFM